MKKDLVAINDVFHSATPDQLEGALERLIDAARVEAIGWTHADACADLDSGKDPRKKLVPEMLERAMLDLSKE